MFSKQHEILYTQGLGQEINNISTIQDINISVSKGEFATVMGTGGSRKSILANILMGEEHHYRGKVFIDGRELQAKNIEESQAAGIYCIESNSSLIRTMSIAENMFLVRGNQRQFALINNKFLETETRSILLEHGLDINPSHLIGTLSRTMQCIIQLIKLARMDAKVIVLYETFNNATDWENDIIRKILEKVKSKGIGLLYISNRYIEILKSASRIFMLKDGRLVRTLYKNDYTIEQLNNYMLGCQHSDKKRYSETKKGSEILRVEKMAVGSLQLVNFIAYAHEVLGIVDSNHENGNILAKALFGLEDYDGDIYIRSKKIKMGCSVTAVKNGIGLLPIDFKTALFDDLSPMDNVTISIWDRMCVIPGIINNRIYKMVGSKAENLPQDAIDRNGIYKLGYEERMDLIITKFLIHPYNVVIIRQPSLNYDILEMQKIHGLIDRLRKENCTVIIISSDIAEAKELCDRLVSLEDDGG